TPSYPDITEQEPVDDEFFSDAAFLGNSLVDGFRLFSGLNNCDYYAATSMTVTAAGPLIDQMAEKQYGKVYILLGINEIGYDVDYFKGLYADMLDRIRDTQPDADIYIMSLTPVSAYKSANSNTFNMTRVKAYNDALYALAKEKDCWYLDICTALAGDDGYLPSNVTSDGVHFAAEHYKVWLEYLRTHYHPVDDAETNS
ncbi:MAG: GDSL-type esterase/lipase family protein, partial [Oscillospiraceae bacterium]